MHLWCLMACVPMMFFTKRCFDSVGGFFFFLFSSFSCASQLRVSPSGSVEMLCFGSTHSYVMYHLLVDM